jgi:hypothetical protein
LFYQKLLLIECKEEGMGMLVLKNSIKAYCASIAIFVLLTLLYAGIIKWTPLPESWSFEGLIVITLQTLEL